MRDLTEEEYDALDEYYTKNAPKIKPGVRGGFFTERRERMLILDQETAAIIKTFADTEHKTPAQVVVDLVHANLKKVV